MENLDLFDDLEFEIDITAPSPKAAETAVIYKGDKWDNLFEVLRTNEDLHEAISDIAGESLSTLITDAVTSIRQTLLDGFHLALGFSGGKDSTCVLHLVLFAMVSLIREGKRDQISEFSWVQYTDTQVENPEIGNLAMKHLDALMDLINAENLPLSVVVGRPAITQSWTGRILTGRGLPSYVTSNAPQCSIDMKVSTGKRVKSMMVQRTPKESRKKVCLLLGSRDAESHARAGNIAKRGGSAIAPVITKDGAELYPIRHWGQSDVWEFLLACGSDPSPRLVLPSYLDNLNELASVYREATGECIWSAKDKKVSDGCGARFGCWACLRGGSDKSMENMLYEEVDGKTKPVERYAYMVNLNRIQRLLLAKQWSWADRHPIGRTIYADGYIKVAPDVFSPAFLARLLRICITADKIEDDRANEVAFQLAIGELEDNAYNRRMAKPQFRIVNPEQVVHIAFLWMFHSFFDRPFHAIEIYRSVWLDEEYEFISDEDLIPVPQTPMPPEYWIKLPRKQWGDSELTDGLSDPMLSAAYFDGQNDVRAAEEVKTADGYRNLVPVTKSKEMEIDRDAACWIIWSEYDRLRNDIDDGFMTNSAGTQFLLRYGVVSLSPGSISSMHRMAQRGQMYREMGLSGNQTMFEVFCRADLEIVSKQNYFEALSIKLKSKYRQAKRMFWIGFTVNYHLHNQTVLGQAIADALIAEKEAEEYKLRQKRVSNAAFGMECNLSTILAIRASWIANPASNKVGHAMIRRYRGVIIQILASLSESERADARLMLDVLLVDILNRINAGQKQNLSNVLQDAVDIDAEAVRRMVTVIRKLVSLWEPSQPVTQKRKMRRQKANAAGRVFEQDQLQLPMAI